MAPSIACAKALFSALLTTIIAGCTEGPVYTLGKKTEPQDASEDVEPDAPQDAGMDVPMDVPNDVASEGGVEQPFEFVDVQPVAEINVEGVQDDNPTLTANEFEIYYTSLREEGPGSGDVWRALRLRIDEPFGSPESVTEVNTEEVETSPAISRDGNTLWIGSNAGSSDDHDIYEYRRGATGAFEPILDPDPFLLVNSPEDDIPRPLGFFERIMPVGSRRDATFDTEYQTFFAARASETAPFDAPVLVDAIAEVGANFIDTFLTNDGLTLLFQRTSDLYYSERDTTDSVDWSRPMLIAGDVNTDGRERDPWLSDDGQRLYFARSVDGTDESFDIYVATRVPAP